MSELIESGPIELILVRHGESVRNHACDVARHGDLALLEKQLRDDKEESLWPLTEEGHRQAVQTGQWIRDQIGATFDAAYVSPFVRARQTAESMELGLTWQVDARLREREWGDYNFDGPDRYAPEEYLRDLTQCAQPDWHSGFPGGESILDMVPRVRDFFRDVGTDRSLRRIIVVTHGGTIQAFQTVVQQPRHDQPHADERLRNCGVLIYNLESLNLELTPAIGRYRIAHPALPGAPVSEWLSTG